MSYWEDWEQWLAEWHAKRYNDTLDNLYRATPPYSYQRSDGSIFLNHPPEEKQSRLDEFRAIGGDD